MSESPEPGSGLHAGYPAVVLPDHRYTEEHLTQRLPQVAFHEDVVAEVEHDRGLGYEKSRDALREALTSPPPEETNPNSAASSPVDRPTTIPSTMMASILRPVTWTSIVVALSVAGTAWDMCFYLSLWF